MKRQYRMRSAVLAAPRTAPHYDWRVLVVTSNEVVQAGPEYTTEAAARSAAKRVGGGLIFISRPDGTKYRYYKQPGE